VRARKGLHIIVFVFVLCTGKRDEHTAEVFLLARLRHLYCPLFPLCDEVPKVEPPHTHIGDPNRWKSSLLGPHHPFSLASKGKITQIEVKKRAMQFVVDVFC